MLNKLFGKKKKDDYFLEFPSKNNENVSEKKESTVAEAKPTKSAKTTTDKPEATPQSSTAKPSSQAQYSVSYDPPEWVKAIKDYTNQDAQGTSGQGGNSGSFAGKYVTNNVPMSRRRPGPSLNKFKEIASKIDA